jgi:putative PIN family toxin of toxin-antitoxin system
MHLVLDTLVLVAAICSPSGASMALLDAALRGATETLISTALLLEYEAVMTRPEHLLVAEYSLVGIQELLDAVCEAGTNVSVHWHWRPQLHDPDDEMVLETAINGYADAIVEFNQADFILGTKRFGLKLLTPSEALESVVKP